MFKEFTRIGATVALLSLASACSAANATPKTVESKPAEQPAAVVYRAPAPRPETPGFCSHRESKLKVREARADRNNLYIEVAHEGASVDEPRDGAPATVELLVDGCPVRKPRVSGTVWRNVENPSLLTISLADIPDGQVDLMVSAHGTESTFAVKKNGRTVSELPFEKRNDITRRPALPERGLPAAFVIRAPVCPAQKAVVL